MSGETSRSALDAAVQSFTATWGSRWATPRGADGQCHVASKAFFAHLRQHGIRGRFVRARHREWGFHGPANDGERYGHTAVEVDGLVYDWTARGNDPTVNGRPHKGRGWNPDAPLPRVTPLPAFHAAWGELVDCCPDCGNTTGHRLLGRCQEAGGHVVDEHRQAGAR